MTLNVCGTKRRQCTFRYCKTDRRWLSVTLCVTYLSRRVIKLVASCKVGLRGQKRHRPILMFVLLPMRLMLSVLRLHFHIKRRSIGLVDEHPLLDAIFLLSDLVVADYRGGNEFYLQRLHVRTFLIFWLILQTAELLVTCLCQVFIRARKSRK